MKDLVLMKMKITFVTSNTGKLREVKKRFEASDIEVVGERIPYPEIQADSLTEVALHGARWLKTRLETPFMLEDSGLFIRALEGFPGVYSAYAYATLGNRGILKLMERRSIRDAVFRTVVALVDANDRIHTFEGQCGGTITKEITGPQGFGFDPIFIPEGEEKTFGEMETEEKNKHSHRSRAFSEVLAFLGDHYSME